MRRLVTSFLLLLALTHRAFAQDPAPLDCHRESVHFTSGRFALAGDLLAPRNGSKHPVIVYVWGAGPSNRQRHIERSPVLRMFLDRGFAVMLYDKPGSGGSTGDIDNNHQFEELGAILADAIGVLKRRNDVDPFAIGLYGSSQASYVMAKALERITDVGFLIAWSCPMQNSVEQGEFLVRNYVLCDGGSRELADAAADAYHRRAMAGSYAEYSGAAAILVRIPAIRDGLGWAGSVEESEFKPADTRSEAFFNPTVTYASVTVPMLVLYAENDRQIDPVQGAETCLRIVKAAGQPLSAVELIPGADHNMNLSPRGCMQDQRDDYRSVGGKTLSPVFVDTMSRWLQRLNKDLERP